MKTVRTTILIAAAVLSSAQAAAQGKPAPAVIESCDGRSKGSSGPEHAPGEEWFSVRGRVLDSSGNPVCGAWVSAQYLVEVKAEWGAIQGPVSSSGMNGEFSLSSIRKGKPFRILVNPYSSAELKARLDGLDAVAPFLKTQQNMRTTNLERYSGEELRSDGPAGVITMDIALKEDPAATGSVVGNVGVAGPFDVDSPAVARILIRGRQMVEVPVDRRNGNFVAFGVPPGQHEVKVEVSSKHRKHTLTKTVTIPPGANGMARVSLAEN